MAPWLIPLIGAAGGALMNKKRPLQGALLGGGLGYLGGAGLGAMGYGNSAASAGGLLGNSAATGQGVALEAMYGGVSPEVAAQMGATANYGAGYAPIIEKSIAANAEDAARLAQPNKMMGLLNTAEKAAGTAALVRQMMPQEQPMQASPVSPAVPNPVPSNFYNSILEQQKNQQMAELQNRMRNRNRLGGGYGLA